MRLDTLRPTVRTQLAPTPMLTPGASPPPAAATSLGSPRRSLQEDSFTPASAKRTTAVAAAQVQSTSVLQRGDKGPQVEALQNDLVKLGHMTSEQVATGRGTFGPLTEAAVKSFQKASGLEQDGVVGPNTRAALDKALAAVEPEPGTWTPAPALEDVKTGGATLKKGMKGDAVEHVQEQLVKHGYLTSDQVDGAFGMQTDRAVKAFQKDKGLVPPPGLEGVVGKTTLEHLEKAPSTSGPDGVTISPQGRQQMQNLLDMARRNSVGKKPDGYCLKHVNDYLDRLTYAQIGNGKSPRLPYAKDYGNWLNQNYQRLGLQKLDITNPYEAPPGAIVVVRAGTPGTGHPIAGDIAVAGGNGKFYNGGEMGYRGSRNFPPGNDYVIGIFVPR